MLKSIIKKVCPIFVLRVFNDIRNKYLYNKIQSKYFKIKQICRELISNQQKIRVGFYVVYDASWGARPLFEKMLKDQSFDVKIVVCPDTARGVKNQRETLNTVYARLSALYGMENVINSCDDNENFIDLSDNFDIIGLANPYDCITHEFYGVKHLVRKNKLTFFNAYGYQGKLQWDIHLMKMDSYNMFWKFFVDNEQTKDLAIKYQYIHGKNIVVSGSCKMDKLAEKLEKRSSKKTIIIAPHHTVREGGLNLSNFIRLSELIQELPLKYKDIDFIFRPHPLLFTTLRCDDLWGDEKVDEYIERLVQNKNLVYSTEGEYFDIFNASDAMIDDCGSFLAEYFYTGKPQCYVLRSESQYDSEYIDYGKKFFDYVYKAYTEQDIYDFIETVVIDGKDVLNGERQKFAQESVMINYPSVADFIVDYLKKELL